MELYFIRHGQSENNANWGQKDVLDVPDPELTNLGRDQAATLAKFLGSRQKRDDSKTWNSQNQHGFGLTHIYTSLMLRAVGTATPIADSLGLPLVAWPDIHETGGIFARDDGDEKNGLPGKTRSYFIKHYPGLILPDWLDDNGWWNRPFESREERKPRAERVWGKMLARHGDTAERDEHRVAIVSHGGFFMYLFTTALGVEMRRMEETHHEYWFQMNNCSITRLDVKNEQVLIAYTNRNHHLPSHLIT
jgi:2,3-bisphosphoglycerate-dependent phosphoglycerate mutase